jgi:hypothetical protein
MRKNNFAPNCSLSAGTFATNVLLSLMLLIPLSGPAAALEVLPAAGGEGIQRALDHVGVGGQVVLSRERRECSNYSMAALERERAKRPLSPVNHSVKRVFLKDSGFTSVILTTVERRKLVLESEHRHDSVRARIAGCKGSVHVCIGARKPLCEFSHNGFSRGRRLLLRRYGPALRRLTSRMRHEDAVVPGVANRHCFKHVVA